MTNTIAIKLVQTLTDIIDIMLDEGAEQERPYAVYSMNVAPFYDKDGVYKIAGKLYINIYSDDMSDADSKGSAAIAAIASGMMDDTYRAVLVDSEVSCEDGVWNNSIEYNITQYRND